MDYNKFQKELYIFYRILNIV